MKDQQVNHPAQLTILRELLFAPQSRFATLQKKASLASDLFNFHLGQLVRNGLVEKRTNGSYTLSAAGKEYANRSSEEVDTPRRCPKVSVLLNVERTTDDGIRQFLIQRRLKSPHYGFYGRISGKVRWGEPFAEAARRTLREETGLTAAFTYKMLYRKYDYATDSRALLEDKLFIVMEAQNIQGEVWEMCKKGQNLWLSQNDFLQLDPQKCFKSALVFMKAPNNLPDHAEEAYFYEKDEY